MGMVDATAFDDREIALVYIAGRMKEAKQVEQLLSAHAVDYAVDVEPFQSQLFGVFTVEYEGVGFYVAAEHAERCRGLLIEQGLLQGLVEADPVEPGEGVR